MDDEIDGAAHPAPRRWSKNRAPLMPVTEPARRKRVRSVGSRRQRWRRRPGRGRGCGRWPGDRRRAWSEPGEGLPGRGRAAGVSRFRFPPSLGVGGGNGFGKRVPAVAEGGGDPVEGEIAAGGQGSAAAHGQVPGKACLEGRRAAGVTRYRFPPSLGLEAVTCLGNGCGRCLALAAGPFDRAVTPVRMQAVNPKSPLKACKGTQGRISDTTGHGRWVNSGLVRTPGVTGPSPPEAFLQDRPGAPAPDPQIDRAEAALRPSVILQTHIKRSRRPIRPRRRPAAVRAGARACHAAAPDPSGCSGCHGAPGGRRPRPR